MTPAARAQYLQQMGIVAYVPRPVHLSPSSQKPIKLLFLLQSATLDWSTPEHQLLKKIMQSIGLPEESMEICHAASLPIALPELNPKSKLVAFGRGLTVSLQNDVIETLTLSDLQHNDAAKRHLWQALKAVKVGYGQ